MRTTIKVGSTFIILAILSTANTAELCGLVFTSNGRQQPAPETRPYLIQVSGQPISVFYDDFDTINVQLIDGSGTATQFYANRQPEDARSFSAANYKNDTALFMTVYDRANKGVRTVTSAVTELITISGLDVSAIPAPSAVAASQNNVAFTWITVDSQQQTQVQLARSIDGGNLFVHRALKNEPTWSALTYVKNNLLYATPTYLGVYQDVQGTSNLFKAAADNVDSPATEINVELENSLQTMSYLSIAAYNKQKYFAVVGQVNTILDEALVGMVIVTLDADFVASSTPVGKKGIRFASMPSLYITEYDELFVSYMLPDNSACIEVYEDLTLNTRTMYWCSETMSLSPGWTGITAELSSGYLAVTTVRNSMSVIGVYKCDFGCGNGVVSPSRNEQCDGGVNCTLSCTCPLGMIPQSPPGTDCYLPPAPVANPPIRAPVPPSQTPVGQISPPTSVVPIVLPILDCNARVNQTHYRSYLSYQTLTEGGAFVTVPIGEQNRFTDIAADQGQPTTFFAGRSKVYNTAVDIPSGQSVSWVLTKYRLSIVEAEANKCPQDIIFSIGIVSPTPPPETVINATIDYVAWVFNVSSNNVSVNVTQTEQTQFYLTVTVQVPPEALVEAIEDIRNITEDTTSLEEHIKDVAPDVTVTSVRGRETGVDNPATFIEEPIAAPISSAHQLVALASTLAMVLVPLL